MIFGSWNTELHRVANGKRAARICSKCNHDTTFYECNLDKNVKAWLVLEVWKGSRRVMQCGECLGIVDYFDFFPNEKALHEQAEAERKRKEEEQEEKNRFEAQQVAKGREEAERKVREEKQKQMAAQVEKDWKN